MADPVTLGMMALTAAGAATSATGTIMGGNAAAAAGQAQQQAMQFRAAQDQQAAQESRAASQRVALDKQREAGLMLSRLQARSAASGGGADDPTVLQLGGDIAGRGQYESLLEMYKGENRARGLQDQATADIMSGTAAAAEGRAKQNASYLSAAGTLIGGGGSAYGQYNKIPQYRYG